MSQYQLHCFAQSGHSYKVALMLELCGADWAPIWVDFFHGGVRSPEYRALNPMGEAPVLVEGDEAHTQSGAILYLLAERYGRFGPETDAENRDVLRWVLWDNHKCSAQLGTLRFWRNFLAPEKRNPDVLKFIDGRCKAALKILDAHLAENNFVAAGRPTIADFSCCSYLFWMDELGLDATDWPHITAWLDRIRALPGWKHPYDLMPGHPMPDPGAAS